MLVAPIPFDTEWNLCVFLVLQRVFVARAPYGLFAAKVLLEPKEKISFSVARSFFCVVSVSIPSSMSFLIELKSPILPD